MTNTQEEWVEYYQLIGIYVGAGFKIVWIISMAVSPFLYGLGIITTPLSLIAAPLVNLVYYNYILGL